MKTAWEVQYDRTLISLAIMVFAFFVAVLKLIVNFCENKLLAL